MEINKINLSLIKLFMDKNNFERWYNILNKELLTNEQRAIFNGFYVFFKENDCESIPIDEFITWFTQIKNKTFNKTESDYYIEILSEASKYKIKHPEHIIKHFHLQELKEQLALEVGSNNFNENKIDEILNNYKTKLKRTEFDNIFCKSSIDDLFREELTKPVYKYKLNILNKSIGGIYSDDLIVIGAPIYTGKSAFLCDLAVCIAKQTNKKVYYFTNEEAIERVKNRIITAACLQVKRETHKTKFDVSNLLAFNNCPNSHKQEIYETVVGDWDQIEIVDCSGLSIYEIEKIIKQSSDVGLVIIDLTNKLSGFGHAPTHERFKQIAEFLKNLAKQYCPIIAAYQGAPGTSYKDLKTNETKFTKWICHTDLEGGRNITSPADVFIGIGQDITSPNYRYLFVSKNRHGIPYKGACLFKAEESSYLDQENVF